MLRNDNGEKDWINKALAVVQEVFDCEKNQINNIEVLKKGMTNYSLFFVVDKNKYIIRVPGEGTSKIINRKQEADVYNAIKGYKICDEPIYINSSTGYKITRFLNNVRTCNVDSSQDVQKCMQKLKSFHNLHLNVGHEFDLFERIDFYESLWKKEKSLYSDYKETKKNVCELKRYIDSCSKEKCLAHIDAVCDNFLFYNEGIEQKLQITDWEYAGMQDPHLDIAMFCIYSSFDKSRVDKLIDLYFERKCDTETRTKIYCYISAAGLLWSNWCEYKSEFGITFGNYARKQYSYAQEYYVLAKELIR